MENKENKLIALDDCYAYLSLYLFCSPSVPQLYGEIVSFNSTEAEMEDGFTSFVTVTGERHYLDRDYDYNAGEDFAEFEPEDIWTLDDDKVCIIPHNEKVLLPISMDTYRENLKAFYEGIKAQACADFGIGEDK